MSTPKEKSIRLSPKHGVNPTIPICYFCNREKPEVILVGRLPHDEAAPSKTVWDRRPCKTCQGHMQRGIILISVTNNADGDNPYRTGGWCVVTDTAIQRIVNTPAVLADILRRRAAFVPDAAWDKIGLPR